MSFAYAFGGLLIQSECVIPRLRPAQANDVTRDIEIAWPEGAPPAGETMRFAWRGRFGLSLWTLGEDWLFRPDAIGGAVVVRSDGRRIQCFRETASADALGQVLVQRVLPRVALLWGKLPLHAAAVATEHGCLLLSGVSGAGKSTLAQAMSQRAGRWVLSDDACILEAAPVRVWPAARGVSLTPEAAEGLCLDAQDGAGDPTRATKTWFDGAPPPPRSLPLAGFVYLNRQPLGAPPRLSSITRAEALKLAPAQLIRFDPSNRRTSAHNFELSGEVIAQSRCFRLDYPEDYAALPAVVDELERAWETVLAA